MRASEVTWEAWLALALTLMLLASLIKLHRVREMHHGFYGIIICIVAFGRGGPHWLWALGILLLFDDTVQHLSEALGLAPRLGDWTPIHRLGSWLLHFFHRGSA